MSCRFRYNSLQEKVVKDSERTHLRDMFGHQRLQEKKYTAGQIDTRWTPRLKRTTGGLAFRQNEDHLLCSGAQIEDILNGRP